MNTLQWFKHYLEMGEYRGALELLGLAYEREQLEMMNLLIKWVHKEERDGTSRRQDDM